MSDIERLTQLVKAQGLQILMLIAMERAKGMPHCSGGAINAELKNLPLGDLGNPPGVREAIRGQIRAFFPEVEILSDDT